MKVNDDSEGREGLDRVNITLGSGQEELVKQVFAANPKTVVVLDLQFPLRHQLDAGERPRHRPPGPQQPGRGQRAWPMSCSATTTPPAGSARPGPSPWIRFRP